LEHSKKGAFNGNEKESKSEEESHEKESHEEEKVTFFSL